MKKIFLIIFSLVLFIELIGIQLNNELIQLICKPLLIPVLITGFIASTENTDLKKWVLAALTFSWIGDVLLLFQAKHSIFFLLGLASFLLAHIFYIIFFFNIRVKENLRSNPWLLLIVVVYYALLITILSPHLGEMKLPVRIYGIVISFIFLLAMHMLYIKNKTAGNWMMLGALLFVISDSILAIDKFYSAFDHAGILIMLTYGLAQLFLVMGAIKYINSSNSN
jgi:uncharacterized membrane protein YhhN